MDNFERVFHEPRMIRIDQRRANYTSSTFNRFDQSIVFSIRANRKENSGDYVGAINDYKESLRLDERDWYITYNQIAVNYLLLQKFYQARLAFDIAIDLKEKLSESGVDEKDIPYTASGIVTKVSREVMYSNRAKAKLVLGDYQDCLEDCNKAIEINPYFSNSYFIAGLLFAQKDNLEKAYRLLDQADSLGHPQALHVIHQLNSEIANDTTSPLLIRED